MAKRKRKQDAIHWLWEFSKKVVVITAALYFISFLYTMVVCYRALSLVADTTALVTLITETNETFRVVIGGYLIKAGIENTVKIARAKQLKKAGIADTPDESTDDIEFINL